MPKDVRALLINKLAKKKTLEAGSGTSATVETEVFSVEEQSLENQANIFVTTPSERKSFVESLVNYLKNTKRLENVDATKIALKHGQSFHNHCQNNLEHLTYCAVLFYFLFVESIEKYQTIHKKKRTP